MPRRIAVLRTSSNCYAIASHKADQSGDRSTNRFRTYPFGLGVESVVVPPTVDASIHNIDWPQVLSVGGLAAVIATAQAIGFRGKETEQ